MEDSGVDDYRDINRANWDERAPAHAASPDHNLQRFLDDPTFISEVVRLDRPWRLSASYTPQAAKRHT